MSVAEVMNQTPLNIGFRGVFREEKWIAWLNGVPDFSSEVFVC
jgi:hypothetical protein